MSTASRPFSKLPGPVKRLVFGMLAVALFFGVGAVIHPDKSMAAARDDFAMRQSRVMLASEANKLAAGAGRTPLQAPIVVSSRPLLGTLTGSPYFVWVYAGPTGPLYTVAGQDGRILATEVDAETLYERCPEVSVTTLQMQPGQPGPLMMVDPSSQQQ
ncbi:MAG TPA: hypothetical protein VFF65_05920 [Phycisphaerales bacterium]|nr:hypothetical protein [Phycisphaerales bacterium]